MEVKKIVEVSKFINGICSKYENCLCCPLCITDSTDDYVACATEEPEKFEQLMVDKHITEIELESGVFDE